MLKKLEKDRLFFQKTGLILGTVVGIIVGLIVSERADRFEIEITEATGAEFVEGAITKDKINGSKEA